MCDRCSALTFFGLAEPQTAMLDSYAAALRTGWSPNNLPDVSVEQLAAIAENPEKFLSDIVDVSGAVKLADGLEVPCLPFRLYWMWDGEFCGSISLRWRPGGKPLPPHVSGNIGFAVVPWKRRRGYATRALAQILDDAREVGLSRVEIVVEPDNVASRTVVESNGGVHAGHWQHASAKQGPAFDRLVIELTSLTTPNPAEIKKGRS